MSEDSQVMLLLCSSLGLQRAAEAPKPLSLKEWNAVARAIDASSFRRPANLTGVSVLDLQKILGIDANLARRIEALLARGAQVAIERERLAALGIWTVTRADEVYPMQWKDRLRAQAPPVLFGSGPIEVLATRALAVVGSRDVDEAGADFATKLGELCASSRVAVVSGAARGVDRFAMRAAIERGGAAIGVLAESLEQSLRQRETRASILDGRLTLITPSHPSAKFTVSAAMARNKLIYGLATRAVVVSSGLEEGGTWAGAVENLRAQWVPLFVRSDRTAPEGNKRLLEMGAHPVALDSLSEDFSAWLDRRVVSFPRATEAFVLREAHAPFVVDPAADDAMEDLFLVVWPRLVRYLANARSDADVATAFQLEPRQARAWLTRAVKEGKAEKLDRPVRYLAVQADSGQRPLFVN